MTMHSTTPNTTHPGATQRSTGDAMNRDALLAAAARLRTEVAKRIVGQEQVMEEVLMAMLAGGHALLVGVPGLANFAGEVMVFFAAFPLLSIYALIAVYGTVITAIFQLRALKAVFYGPMPDHFARDMPVPVEAVAGVGPNLEAVAVPAVADVSSLADRGPYVLLTLASLVIGFMPFLLIHLIQPTVKLLPFVK